MAGEPLYVRGTIFVRGKVGPQPLFRALNRNKFPVGFGCLDIPMAYNHILNSLLPDDFALIQLGLETVQLPLQRKLELRGYPIEAFYFLESGLASVVATAGAVRSIEVGVIGKEGMTGLAALLGADRSHHEVFMQTAGRAKRITVSNLRQAMQKSSTLKDTLLLYAHTLVLQVSYTALASGRYQLEERLARWLLMALDRAQGPTVHLTHDSLAVMLGTRRAGVTVALNELQKRGIITLSRGGITVIDRVALEDASNGSYGAPEAEYRRLFGDESKSSDLDNKKVERASSSGN
jgi:CRP-like cAMP-binding protein